ncbi:MAG: hypothetical protein ACI9CV_001257 [Ilumatobacter sp.]|jgi:hypothetical protein
MPGPLPEGNKRRRNAPTIPTTALPVSGFGLHVVDSMEHDPACRIQGVWRAEPEPTVVRNRPLSLPGVCR